MEIGHRRPPGIPEHPLVVKRHGQCSENVRAGLQPEDPHELRAVALGPAAQQLIVAARLGGGQFRHGRESGAGGIVQPGIAPSAVPV